MDTDSLYVKDLPDTWGLPVLVIPDAVTRAMKVQGHTYFTDGRHAVLHFSNEGGMFLHYTDTDEVFYLPMERLSGL